MATCKIPDCDLDVVARGWCSKHYTRWQRHGDALMTTRTPPMPAGATEKLCPRCDKVKPLDQFGQRSRSSRPKGYCLDCMAGYDRDYADTDVGRENRRLARSRWNTDNHEYFLQYRYGIDLERYESMVAEQGDRCAICGTDSPGPRLEVWHVDHCHDSNRVRGLLCGLCNRGLGQFKDDARRLRAAAEYIDNHNAR